MGARTGGRAVALQVLYSLDSEGALEAEGQGDARFGDVLAAYWNSFEGSEAQGDEMERDAREFGDALVRSILESIGSIDASIRRASTNWRLERMPRVDRNVVRIGAYELMRRPDVPRAVAIDEAIELAKRFGGDDSAKFVNGILEKVADEAGRFEVRTQAARSVRATVSGKRTK